MASASTFVGNGGNVGDIELQMTLQQLAQTFRAIEQKHEDLPKDLCVCQPSYEGRPLCDILKSLSEPQVKFCAQYMRDKSPELADKAKDKERIRFTWTHDVIEVREAGRLRAVDAVTNPKDMSMTLNQKGFLKMSVDERAFLVGHEMFHFTSHDGKTLTDEGAIGPFAGEDGRRQLINAMSASLVMTAKEVGAFRLTNATLKRSQSSRDWWLSLGIQGFSPRYNSENPYGVERLDGSEFSARYQFTPQWGVIFDVRNTRGTRNRMTQIQGNEDRQAVGLGLAYRFFPSDNPLTFSGQSHFVFAATLDKVRTSYQLQSTYTYMKEDASGNGVTLSAKYYLPFRKSLWGYGGLSYSEQKLDLPITDIHYSGGTAVSLGVSYGF